jgi:putative hydrolase of HD superfamily
VRCADVLPGTDERVQNGVSDGSAAMVLSRSPRQSLVVAHSRKGGHATIIQNPLTKQLAFLAEIDALKSVVRQSPIIGCSRRENSAEHSWHLAMFALILTDEHLLDTGKVILMLLIHDIVEIDVGDAPIHGIHDAAALEIAEMKAAERLFGMLPTNQATRLLSLWREFEAAETPEAKCAKALDRLQPLLLNTLTGGGTCTENNVSEEQVYERYGPMIERGSPALWETARALVQQHFANAPA